MKELYLKNELVDLSKNTNIVLNFQTGKIGEIKPVSSGTWTVKLPKTAHNIELFERCNDQTAGSEFPYIVHDVRYYENGIRIFDHGRLTVLAVSDTFECVILWGNVNFIDKLKETDMQDIPLGNQVFPNNTNDNELLLIEAFLFEGIVIGEDESGNTTYTYREAPTSFRYTRAPSIIREEMVEEFIRPHFHLRHLINRIAEAADINYIIADDDLEQFIDNVVIPQTIDKGISNGYDLHYSYFMDRIKVELSRFQLDIRYYTSTAFRTTETPFGTGSFKFHIPTDDFYDLDFIVSYMQTNTDKSRNMTIMITMNDITGTDSEGNIRDGIIDDAAHYGFPLRMEDFVPKKIIDEFRTVSFTIDHQEISEYKKSLSKVFFPRGTYSILILGQGNDENHPVIQTRFSYIFNFDNVNIDFNIRLSEQKQIEVIHDRSFILDYNFLFRDVKAYDVLSGILQSFGILTQVKFGILELFTYNTVAGNIRDARDWSDKLIANSDNYKSLIFDDNISQINRLRWKDEEQYKGLMNGQFGSKSLKKIETIYIDNKIFSQSDRYHKKYPAVNFVTRSAEAVAANSYIFEDTQTNPKMLYLTGETAPVTHVAQGYKETGFVIHLYDLINRGKYVSIDEFNYDNPNGIRKFFNTLINSLNTIKLPTTMIMLQPEDIKDFDFSIPVYLRQFGAYYYVYSINNYTDGKPAEVKLLKLKI